MGRTRKILIAGACILIGLPLAALSSAFIAGNLPVLRRELSRRLPGWTGDTLAIGTISGVFPTSLRADRIDLRDAQGVYASISDAALDLSLLPLLTGELHIMRIAAGQIALHRLPQPTAPAAAGSKPAGAAGGLTLPLRVTLGALSLPVIDLDAAVAGSALHLAAHGSASLRSLQDAQATLSIADRGSAARYALNAAATQAGYRAQLAIDEATPGPLSHLAKTEDLGGLFLHASLDGSLAREQLDLRAGLGPLRAELGGTLDLPAQAMDLTLQARAAHMAPAAGVAFDAASLTGSAQGRLSLPDARLAAEITGLSVQGSKAARIEAGLSARAGRLLADVTASNVTGPGAQGALLAQSPIVLHADADLLAANASANLSLRHALIDIAGHATLGPEKTLDLHANLPNLAPLAAAFGQDAQGRLSLQVQAHQAGGVTRGTLAAAADFTGGAAPLATLLGHSALTAALDAQGGDVTQAKLALDGRRITLRATASLLAGTLDADATLTLPDLAAINTDLLGALTAALTLHGPRDGLGGTLRIDGTAGSSTITPGPVQLRLQASGLPRAADANITAAATLDRAPLSVQAHAAQSPDGALALQISKAVWKSLRASADLSLPAQGRVPLGSFSLQAGNLDDFSKIAGQALGGSVTAAGSIAAQGDGARARITATGRNLAAGTSTLAALDLTANAGALPGAPNLDVSLNASGIHAAGWQGSAGASARGPLAALALSLRGDLQDASHRPGSLQGDALLNATQQMLTLGRVNASYAGQSLALRAPARLTLRDGVAVDQLAASLGDARISIAGRVTPQLNLTADVTGLSPSLAQALAPDLAGTGHVSAHAKLAGTTAAPTGNITLRADALHLDHGPAAGLPPISAQAAIALAANTATLDANIDGGDRLRLAARGTAGLGANAKLALQSHGRIDLSLADPILSASGQRAGGMLAFDATLAGTTAKPRAGGSLTLQGGLIQDYAQGFYLHDIAALVHLAGDHVILDHVTGTAGKGSVSLRGSIGAFAPGVPVDLHLTASHAKLLNSDLLIATISSDLSLTGQAAHHLRAGGSIFIDKAEVTVPDGLPPNVAKIDIRRPGDRPTPQAPAATLPVDLAVALSAPNNVFVRGHGLDAELGGTLNIGGTADAPDIQGGFKLRRGEFSMAGTTLKFSKGEVGFNGAGVSGKIDPTLDFAADSTQGGVTATLAVAGYASNPKITLSSVPELPQDEVLAHLMFGTSMKDLSPLQIAQIGAALAELSGVTGGGEGVMGKLRKGLGLDRLSVGGGSGGAGASVEAGRYVMKDVYVGAKQDTSGGGGTTVQVQVDLTDRLKARAEVAAGGGTAQGSSAQSGQGTKLGLSYGFEY